MRSLVALAALTLSGSLDLTSASLCKPRPSTTGLIPSGTVSSAAASETAGVVVIKSVIEGGGFSVVPPGGGVPGFTVQGDAEILVGPGYKGDGSQDAGCLSLKASNEDSTKKRDIGSLAGVAQLVAQLSLTKPYTVRFFYLIVTTPSLNICQLTAALSNQMFFQTWIVSMGTSVQWGMALEQVTAAERSAPLSISMNCLLGGSAQVYVDSLFVSNQVTPQTIDDHPLDLGGSASTFTTTSSSLSVTHTPVSTTTFSSSATETDTSSDVKTTSVPPIIPTHLQSSDASTGPKTPGSDSPHTPTHGGPNTRPNGS
jgi:hypothetical protein